MLIPMSKSGLSKSEITKWGTLKKQLKSMRRGSRRAKPMTLLLLLFAIASLLFVFQWIYSIPPPKMVKNGGTAQPCRESKEGFVLGKDDVCAETCGRLCFPRIHGICFGKAAVTICSQDEDPGINDRLPRVMRFHVADIAREKVPVREGTCSGSGTWIHGLHMVADLSLMPHGRAGPNPHHESEKVIPAILISQLYGLKNSSFYWFANPHDVSCVSPWSKGLLRVFENQIKIKFLAYPQSDSDDSQVCFDDAILFAGLTNAGYIPTVADHDWLRNKVLGHCKIPATEVKKPISRMLALHRPNSSRNIANFEDMRVMLEKELHLPVTIAEPGPREFCQQVRLVAEADLVITPHGSHNVAVLFMRPGAVVLEIFPLLYYVDWLGNLVHAGQLHHYELYGTWTTEGLGMPFLMRIYALLFGWNRCFSVRQCMNYGKTQRIYVDIEQLEQLLHNLASSCFISGLGSRCLTTRETTTATEKTVFHHSYQ